MELYIQVWECDFSHDISGVVADYKISISLQLLGLKVDLTTGVVVVTFELLIHRVKKVLCTV